MTTDDAQVRTIPLNTAQVPSANSGRFIGRVGVLAATLGIGLMSASWGVAAADPGTDETPVQTAASAGADQGGAGRNSASRRDRARRTAPTTESASDSTGPDSTGPDSTGPEVSVTARAAAATASALPSLPRKQSAPVVHVAKQIPSHATGPATVGVNPVTAPASAPPAESAPAASVVAASVVAASVVTAPAAAPTATPPPAPAAATGIVEALLGPLTGNNTGNPAESPAAWVMLAATRRSGRPGKAATAGRTAFAAATATGTTTKITWAYGTNTVLNFNPATDKLDFAWMGPAAFTITEKSGSTQIGIVNNNQTYTLSGVGLGGLTMTNIVALDSGTATKWRTALANATVPTVSVTNATVAEGNSGAAALAFTVALSKASTGTVTVGYATANGTATAGSDYTAASGTLTFAPGVTSQKITVAVAGDTVVEPDETVTVTLSTPSGANLGAAVATGTITNDDIAPVLPTVSVANATVAEGNSGTTTLPFTVTLSKASTSAVTVGYATANGTATAGSDYTAASGTLTFAPGVTSQKINVGVTGDAAVESDETFTVTLTAPSGATLATAAATGTITNDDVAPALPTVSVASATVAEGNSGSSTLGFTVSLSKASTSAVTVGYATANGTATAGADYTAAAGTLTFAPGVVSQTVNVAVAGDTVAEPDETLSVTLSNAAGATLATAVATGTITNDDAAQPGTAQWGNAFYAPYVDMGGWPVPDLLKISQTNGGGSLFTAAFMQADPNGKLAWAGLTVLEPGAANDQARAIDQSIKALKAAGGDVMISLGGQAGTSLAQWGSTHGMTAAQLADAYAGVVDTYGVTHLDFDIEGAAVADPTSIALNSAALKLLQQARPAVQVWYTLPVLPTGLTADGIKVVESALKAGVTLAGVNVMAMDYGESAAPTSGASAKTMGAYAIDSAESTYGQLTKLYSGYGQSFGYKQLGITPMLGVNDITSEVFTLADAQAVEDYARTKGVGMLALWSVTRDTPGPLGVSTYTHSGMSAPAGSFAKIFDDYGTVNTLNYGSGGGSGGGSGTPVSGGTTTTITWSWATNTVLNFNTATDKLDFGWFQPANFEVADTSGSTQITIVGNNQTYTLSGVPLSKMSINNIIALDSTTVAKWQNAIAGAGASAPAVPPPVVSPPVVSTPTVSIAGATAAEGNSGTTTLPFTVTLSKASTGAVTVGYATANGTATAGSDYTATSGTLTFAPGVISQKVNVAVTGDTAVETTETFTVTLSGPAGATLAAATATGTITDDDTAAAPPTVSIANATVAEGNSGSTTMAFTVSLSKASTGAVSVGYATANGTATAGADYTATSGTLTFAPGVTSQTVNVNVTGDTAVESTETLTVTLTGASGATLAAATATGSIIDDDTVTAPVAAQKTVLAAYYPEWGVYSRNFQPADIPAGELTHVIYSFLNLTSSGDVAIYDTYAALDKRFTAAESVSGEADQWYYPPSDPRSTQTVWGNFNQLAQLKAKNPDLRVSIALGGWTLSTNFSSVASTASGREKLATSIVTFLNTYRMFDGIDFDWEYPGGGGLAGNSASPNDGANYAALLQLVRTKLDGLGTQLGRRYEISVASPAGYDKISNFNLAGLAPSVDFFNLMSYDFHGTWDKTTGHQSAFTGDPNGYDIKTAVGLYLAAGVNPNKIVLGAPLYTRAWSGVADGGDGGYAEAASGAAPGTFEAGSYDYKDLLAQLQDPASGWKLYWDDNAQAAYLYNATQKLFSSFETPTSVAQKSEWAQALGLRGMMFWDISNDAVTSPESLVKAAYSSWMLHQNLATVRAQSALKGEVIIGGDGVITPLPVTSTKV